MRCWRVARTRSISEGKRKPAFGTLGALCRCLIYAKSRRSARTPTTLSIRSGEPSYECCLVARHNESLPESRPVSSFLRSRLRSPRLSRRRTTPLPSNPPEFWKVPKAALTSSKVLSVRGIRIEQVSGIATYEVSTNQDFDPPQQVELSPFPDERYVMIERNKEGFISTQAR